MTRTVLATPAERSLDTRDATTREADARLRAKLRALARGRPGDALPCAANDSAEAAEWFCAGLHSAA